MINKNNIKKRKNYNGCYKNIKTYKRIPWTHKHTLSHTHVYTR